MVFARSGAPVLTNQHTYDSANRYICEAGSEERKMKHVTSPALTPFPLTPFPMKSKLRTTAEAVPA
jgi:hypothetical protein